MICAFARLKDPDLADWMEERGRLPQLHGRPDHAGDRRPTTSSAWPRSSASQDGWPVVCEPFTQWVLEDRFGQGRPPFEDAGVQMVDDVVPYELMKLRLLNASHQALCYLGYLAGLPLRPRGLPGPAVRRLPARLHGARGQSPTLPPVPGVDLDAYRHELIERFANPEVRDTLARLCAESSDRIPKWLVPVIREQPRAPAARSSGPRWSSPRGRATPRAWTSRASRSRSSTASRTGSWRRRRGRTRTRWPSSATATCSATSPTTSASPRPTPRPLDALHAQGARATLEARAGLDRSATA